MKKSIMYLLFLLASLLVASCSKDKGAGMETADELASVGLKGRWTWVSTTGGFAGVTVTPESSGKTMVVEFAPEDIFNKYVNGKKVYSSPYVIQQKDSIIQFTTLALYEGIGLGFDHQTEQKIKLEQPNKLWFIDPCCDLFTFEFIKEE